MSLCNAKEVVMAEKLKLTPKRKQVLSAIVARAADTEAPCHHRIAVDCGKEYCKADWAHSALRELYVAGYIEHVGRDLGARTWRPTDAGRAALRYAPSPSEKAET